MMFRLSTAGTPAWKLGLIPVLAGVLFKVTRTSGTDVDAVPEAVARQVEAASQKDTPARPPTMLPEFSLQDALAFDPFERLALPAKPVVEELLPEIVEAVTPPPAPLPPAAATPVVNVLEQRAATLKQLKVSAVFPSAKGAMAIIDSKTVRAGDWLSPGVRVVEIRESDVILRVEDGEGGGQPGDRETR
ncbi:MAG TPA: general secretion pathway protein GspB [Caulifigura sp.]|jgi:hypothetical protein|nr:general secretion pathway protein GspB [Caulifigura sp.]